MIFHIVSRSGWEAALTQEFYARGSLAAEGFINTSKADRVKAVLARCYQEQTDLLLLHIDEGKLVAEVKYELAPSVNEEFPHILGG